MRILLEILLGVAVLGLLAMSLELSRELEGARASSAPGGRAAAPRAATESGAPLAAELDALRVENLRLRAELSRMARTAAETDGEAGSLRGQAEAREEADPRLRAAWRSPSGASRVEARYGGLIASLGLSGREESALRELLARRLEGSMTGADSDPQAEAIRELIGDSNLEALREYERAEVERQLVGDFKHALTGEDVLSSEQEHALVEALFEERRHGASYDPFSADQPADPTRLSDEELVAYERGSLDLIERQLEAAERILTPAQLEQLETNLRRDATLRVMGLEMAREVLKGGAAPLPDPEPPQG